MMTRFSPVVMRPALSVVLVGLALVGAARVHAQDTPPSAADPADTANPAEPEDVAASRATGFRAVDGAQVEDVPGGLMLVGAYGAILVLLLLFLYRQHTQLGALTARVEALRTELERARAEKGGPGA